MPLHTFLRTEHTQKLYAALFNCNRLSVHSAVHSSRHSWADTTVALYCWVASS